MRSNIADFILCQEASNPSRELLSESGGYTADGGGGFHEIPRYHGTRKTSRKENISHYLAQYTYDTGII